MGSVGEEGHDLARSSSSSSSSNHLLNLFPPNTTIRNPNPNPNHHMTSQNPNPSPSSLSLLNHLSNTTSMYNPQLNPNANEYYHDHVLNLNSIINNGSDHQTLEAAFNRLSLFPESPSSPTGPGFGAIARPCIGVQDSGFRVQGLQEQEYYYLQQLHDLYKRRVESAVKGQHFDYNINRNNKNNTLLSHDLQLPIPLLNPIGNNNGSTRRGRSSNKSSFEGSSSSSSSSSWKRPSYSSLEELKGRIGFAAKDQHGCLFLQEKLKGGDLDEIELVFSEVVDCLQDLIIDQFGNSLVQKLFEICDETQITKVLYSPAISNERKLLAICTNDHGTRAIQKLLECITTMEQKALIVSSLSSIGLRLMKDQKGHHVIQQCLRLFPFVDTKCLLHQVAENCLDLALDRQGCCVLQLCLSQARGEYLDHLLAEIASNSLALSVNCFGNYVLQFVLELGIPEATAAIASQLYGNYVALSMNKCASNVVEKVLQSSDEDQSSLIIHELLRSPNFLNVCQDSYGNYVVQTALRVSKGDVHKCLVHHIVKVLYPFLQSHPHGKNVLQEAKPNKNRGFNKRR